MDGWNTTFILGRPIFRGYVSFRECNLLLIFGLPKFETKPNYPRMPETPASGKFRIPRWPILLNVILVVTGYLSFASQDKPLRSIISSYRGCEVLALFWETFHGDHLMRSPTTVAAIHPNMSTSSTLDCIICFKYLFIFTLTWGDDPF